MKSNQKPVTLDSKLSNVTQHVQQTVEINALSLNSTVNAINNTIKNLEGNIKATDLHLMDIERSISILSEQQKVLLSEKDKLQKLLERITIH